MLQFTAFKKNHLTVGRRYGRFLVRLIDHQLAPIGLFPMTVEINDDGILPAFIVPELIEVTFVKSSFFIEGEVKFMFRNARIAGAVQVQDEAIDQRQEFILIAIVMFLVEPIDLISPDEAAMRQFFLIARAAP